VVASRGRSARGVEGDVPAADGAIVVRTLERISRRVPAMPGEEDASFADARRADALVALCSERIASDPDRDRATIVIHADAAGAVNGETEDDGVVPPETVRRLLCTSRIEVVRGDARLGPAARLAPAWMLRQVRYRDRGCTFPGCGARRFTEAHHIRWWRQGGRTTPENLALVCSFHHRLVHEHGWRMRRGRDGAIGWLRPSGDPWPAGPIPDPGRVPSLERARRPAFDGSLDEPVRLRARPRARAPSRPSSA
jgi:hypothetical protein